MCIASVVLYSQAMDSLGWSLFIAPPLPTLDPKSFDYWFLATLDEMGQGIPNYGDKRGGRKGYQCDQNYNLIERRFHCEGRKGKLLKQTANFDIFYRVARKSTKGEEIGKKRG